MQSISETNDPFLVSAVEDVYSNSFISPNSAAEAVIHESEVVNITSGQSEIVVLSATPQTKLISPSESTLSISTHERTVRSANPILSRTASSLDDLPSYKNVADSLDSNDVELSGRIMQYIQPSKTVKEDMINDSMETAEMFLSGEAQGAPQARSIPLPEPQDIKPTATTTPSFVTSSYQPGQARQANPDIQDIITGIVKLLNGNGATNTVSPMGRPLRPLSTRINNRGPPRITDVPALPPDFDVPAPPLPPPPLGQLPPPVSTTRMPTPYPFDIPPQNTSPVRPYVNGMPLPEQLVPQSSKRPGFYRPVTIPPWNRPSHRRPAPQRRPPYKPLPPYKPDSAQVSITSDKPNEDILTLDLGSHLESLSESSEDVRVNVTEEEQLNTNSSNEDIPEVTTEVVTENSTQVEDRETMEFEKNKEKSSSKMDKHTMKPEPVPVPSSVELLNSTTSEKITSQESTLLTPTSTSESSSLAITQSAMNTTIINTTDLTATSVVLDNTSQTTPMLESSIQEVLQTLKDDLLSASTLSATPTQGLPHISTSELENKGISTPLGSKDPSTPTTG